MPLVMGVDSSTQATKVEVRDADDGTLVGSGRSPHPVTHPPRSEQDPAVWWRCLGEASSAAVGGRRVTAVAAAAQQHGMVVLDEARRVLRPAKLWNDTESAPDAEGLVGHLGGPQAWASACGSVPVAAYTITKLSWLRRVEPDLFADVAHVLLPHDWLTLGLSGELCTDRGDASGTGYWSPAEGRWRTDLLDLVSPSKEWSSTLPAVLGPLEPAGALQAVDLPGAVDDAVVAPGTGDNMAAALGVGLEPGDVAMSLGTSGTVFAVADEPTADASGAVAGFADATGRFLPLVCTLNATRVTDAFARLLGVDGSGLDRLALAAPAGAGGVVLVPYLDGERTPNRPDASGVLTGLRADVTPAQVARAAVEGVVCGLLDGLDALVAAGVETGGRLVLLGGGARSAAFRRIVADLAARPVTVPADGEWVATGACVQAAAVLHQRPPQEVARAWGLGAGRAIDPEPVDAEAVRARYAQARR